MKVFFTIIFSLFFLSACGGRETVKYVDKTQYIKTEVRSDLLEKCEATEPPDKDQYLKANKREKESLLTGYIISLHSDIRKCNIKIVKIKETLDEQNKAIEAKNNEKK